MVGYFLLSFSPIAESEKTKNQKRSRRKRKDLGSSLAAEKRMPTLTKLYSMEEAATHNKQDDCWVVIDGKVCSFFS